MKTRNPKYKKWLIGIAIPILIYFTWGWFGFAGAWIPGKYDTEKKQYNILWGLLGNQSKLDCERGTCRIKAYTPFKRHGLIDTTGKVIIPISYYHTENPYRHSPDLIFAIGLNGKQGVINRKNEIIVPFEYDPKIRKAKTKENQINLWNYEHFSDGEFTLSKGENFVLFDSLGKQILPAEYSRINLIWNREVKRQYILAEKGTYCYLVLENGKKIKYNFIMEKAYMFNHKCNVVFVQGVQSKDLDPNLWTIETYSRNSYTVPNPDTRININNMKNLPVYHGLFDSLGNAILPLEYEKIEMGKNSNFAIATKNGKAGVFDLEKRKWIIPLKYIDIYGINSALPMYKAWIDKSANKVDYYDYDGNLILSSNIYISSINYRDGKILFYKNGNHYRMYYNKDKQKFIWYKL